MNRFAAIACTVILAASAAAQQRLMLESDSDAPGGSEHYQVTYNGYGNLIADNQASAQYSQINVNPVWGARGLTWGDGAYRMLLESDSDAGGGSENYLVTYNTWNDVLADNQASATYTQINVNPVWGVQGMAWDGSQYHLLLESDSDAGGGLENYLVSYNSLTDLINDNQTFATYTQINVNPVWGVRGFDWDGSQYHLLLESDSDAGGGLENYLVSYNSLTDLINDNQASATYTQINVNPVWGVHGLATHNPVPEPATMTVLGLGAAAVIRRRKRQLKA